MQSARLFIVKGRVQGVWFRDSTRRIAEPLALVGHAINLPNGDVEVYACGETAALDQLQDWLKQGPPMANVSEVISTAAEVQSISGFRTG